VIAELLNKVKDPEIPSVTIADLGILREVRVEGSEVTVTITPTYSGCPALDTIRADITRVLADHGYRCRVLTSYSPPWTTDMITVEGRVRLAEAGIAPPGPWSEVVCPRCASGSPVTVSEFGSTACKALLVCSRCGDPFHYFKELR
jgi:ring-1,2-phenylacetyl-CoA epoxidase subunit PaaD